MAATTRLAPAGAGQPQAAAIQLAPATADRFALTGQHVQHRVAHARDELDREVDAQQPGDVVGFVAQLASGVFHARSSDLGRAVAAGWSLESENAGETTPWMPKYPAARFGSQTTDGQDQIGVVQCAMDQNRLARLVGRQIGEPRAIGRIVGRQRDPLADRLGEQSAGIAAGRRPVRPGGEGS